MAVYEIVTREAERFPWLRVDWPEGAVRASVWAEDGTASYPSIDEYIANPAWHGVLDCYNINYGPGRWKIDCRHIVGWRLIHE